MAYFGDVFRHIVAESVLSVCLVTSVSHLSSRHPVCPPLLPFLPSLPAVLYTRRAVVLGGQLTYQLMGTPSYMAPESILHGMYGKEVDW